MSLWMLSSNPKQNTLSITFVGNNVFLSQCGGSEGYSLTKMVNDLGDIRKFVKVSNITKQALDN